MFKITDACVNCGACEPDCPVGAISEKDDARVIDQDKCISCGTCVADCPADAIVEEQSIFFFWKENMRTKGKFIVFLRILLLIAACVAATVVLVFPLWKFSTSAPRIYTATVLILFAAFIVYFIIQKILSKKRK